MRVRALLAVIAVARVAAADVLERVEVRGDYALRHANVMARALAITPDGKLAASGSVDGSIAIFDLADGHVVRSIATPHRSVNTVALAPDGKRVASGGPDGFARVWDVASGKLVWEARLDPGLLDFSRDGTRLVGDRRGQVRAWNAATGAQVWTAVPLAHKARDCNDMPHDVALMPDRTTSIDLAAVDCHDVRNVDRVPTGNDVSLRTGLIALGRVGPFPAGVGASADGTRVAVAEDERITVFEVAGTTPHVSFKPARPMYRGVQVLPAADPRYVITSDYDSISSWEVATGKEAWRLGYNRAVIEAAADVLAVLAAGECFALDANTGKELWRRKQCNAMRTTATKAVLQRGPSALDIVDVHTGVSLLKRPEVGPLGSIHELVADATRVAAAGTDGSAWSWSSATPVHVSGGVFDRGQLHFNADGMLVVVTTTPRATPRVERYRGDPPALVDATDVPHKAALGIGAITAGDRLVVEEVLDHSYRRVAYDLAGKAAPVHFVAWSPKSPQTGDMHDEGLDGGAMTRDLARAYIYGELQALHAWDVKTGTLVAVAPAPKGGRSTAVTLSPDEAHVAIGSVAGEVDVYRAKDLKLEHTLTDAKRRVHATAIAGELVVAAADDGLFAWRIDTGALVATIDFAASNEQPTALAFTPDGTTLWVGTSLGNVHRFSVHAP